MAFSTSPKECVTLDHGSGGIASQQLIGRLLRHLSGQSADTLEDAAVLASHQGRLVFSTDSYVVDPIFFPGGDIGLLAVHGTINDLAMRGARPLYLSLAMILEEGLPLADLELVAASIAKASREAAVPIVTGDTKVVPHGKADKIFLTTAGIGVVDEPTRISAANARPGDAVLISGTIGDHGITIMSQRAGITLGGDLRSDTMALHGLVAQLLADFPGAIHVLRDPTRGGVATALNEIAAASSVAIELQESLLPVRPAVRAACGLLGLDPLYLANEGKCLLLVEAQQAPAMLHRLQEMPEGREAAIIGTVLAGPAAELSLRTPLGGSRLVMPLHGQPLPRIC